MRCGAAEVPQSYARLGVEAFPLCISQRNRLRGTIAQLIGANPEDIGLVPSTSMGINAIALSMDWQSGDRVVLFDGEFPTNITPWQRASIEFGLQISMLSLDGFGDDSGTGLARLESELRQGVRLVAVSAVQFQTGLAMPLKAMGALCKRYGALLAVDAIQAAGAMPLDVVRDGIDFLAAGSHKWLMGLEGCGFVYISPRQMERLVPRVAGWLSHEDGLRFLFEGEGHLRYDRPIRRRADWLADRRADRRADRLGGRQAGWRTGWKVGWQAGGRAATTGVATCTEDSMRRAVGRGRRAERQAAAALGARAGQAAQLPSGPKAPPGLICAGEPDRAADALGRRRRRSSVPGQARARVAALALPVADDGLRSADCR